MSNEIDQTPAKMHFLDDIKSNITNFLSKISHKEKMKIDLTVARLFYTYNIPFPIVESDSFKSCFISLKKKFESEISTLKTYSCAAKSFGISHNIFQHY